MDVDDPGPLELAQPSAQQRSGQSWGSRGDLVEGSAAEQEISHDDRRPALREHL
jgi:hypothetical protein